MRPASTSASSASTNSPTGTSGLSRCHDVEIGVARLQPVEGFGELPRNHVGIVERRVQPLGEHHHVLAHATRLHPPADEAIGAPGPIVPRRIDHRAAALVERIEHDRRVRRRLQPDRAKRQDGCRLLDPGQRDPPHRLRRLGQRPPVELGRSPLGLLDAELQPDVGAPLVEHAHVAERIRPRHARRIELAALRADRPAPPLRSRRRRASAAR